MSHSPFVRLMLSGLAVAALGAVLAAQATERVLYVTAFDAKTNVPLDTLTVDDVRVTEDGRAREVLRVTPATTPMAIAVVVDNQQAAQATIADLRRGLTPFLRDISSLGPVALITVADRPTILQDYTTDVDRLTKAADRVFAQPDSGATMLDAIVEVSKGLKRREEDRAAIVLVTLEQTEFSTLHFTQVLDGLKDGGAMMSGVVLLNQRGSNQNDAARNRAVVLDRGIRESGGTRVDVLTSIGYPNALTQIATALRHQFRVVYSRPQQLIPPERIEARPVKAGVTLAAGPARDAKDR